MDLPETSTAVDGGTCVIESSLFCEHVTSTQQIHGPFSLTQGLTAPLRRKDVESGVPSNIVGVIPKFVPNDRGLIATAGSIVIVECTAFAYTS